MLIRCLNIVENKLLWVLFFFIHFEDLREFFMTFENKKITDVKNEFEPFIHNALSLILSVCLDTSVEH